MPRLDNAALCQRLLDLLAESTGGTTVRAMANRLGVDLWISPREFCTDNAAMAAIAWDLLEAGRTSPLDVDVLPGLVRKR